MSVRLDLVGLVFLQLLDGARISTQPYKTVTF